MIFGDGLAQPLYRLTVTFIAMSPAVFSHIARYNTFEQEPFTKTAQLESKSSQGG